MKKLAQTRKYIAKTRLAREALHRVRGGAVNAYDKDVIMDDLLGTGSTISTAQASNLTDVNAGSVTRTLAT